MIPQFILFVIVAYLAYLIFEDYDKIQSLFISLVQWMKVDPVSAAVVIILIYSAFIVFCMPIMPQSIPLAYAI